MKNLLDETLRITEIFYSLQGETNTVGLPTAFIRLTGCPLRCQYCDTTYAFKGGNNLTIAEILTKVKNYNPRYITVTGGEPLVQKACLKLLDELINLNYVVSLETSGALDVSKVNPKVVKVLDLKTPDSKESHRNLFSNLEYLTKQDQIKFVICSNSDYLWAKNILQEHKLDSKYEVLFSPSHTELNATELAGWILQDNLRVRFQLQLHKILWNDARGK